MQIAVGSTNQVKINAVIEAIRHTWPEGVVTGFETESGVGEQPRTDLETKTGSINRAIQALNFLQQTQGSTLFGEKAHCLGVGLEGGVDETEDGLANVVWCSVVDTQENVFSSSGARFVLPEIIAKKIRAGGEMGPIMDKLLGDKDTKKKQGMLGVVTKGFYNRTEEYASIARLTIGLWYGRNWADQLLEREQELRQQRQKAL